MRSGHLDSGKERCEDSITVAGYPPAQDLNQKTAQGNEDSVVALAQDREFVSTDSFRAQSTQTETVLIASPKSSSVPSVEASEASQHDTTPAQTFGVGGVADDVADTIICKTEPARKSKSRTKIKWGRAHRDVAVKSPSEPSGLINSDGIAASALDFESEIQIAEDLEPNAVKSGRLENGDRTHLYNDNPAQDHNCHLKSPEMEEQYQADPDITIEGQSPKTVIDLTAESSPVFSHDSIYTAESRTNTPGHTTEQVPIPTPTNPLHQNISTDDALTSTPSYLANMAQQALTASGGGNYLIADVKQAFQVIEVPIDCRPIATTSQPVDLVPSLSPHSATPSEVLSTRYLGVYHHTTAPARRMINCDYKNNHRPGLTPGRGELTLIPQLPSSAIPTTYQQQEEYQTFTHNQAPNTNSRRVNKTPPLTPYEASNLDKILNKPSEFLPQKLVNPPLQNEVKLPMELYSHRLPTPKTTKASCVNDLVTAATAQAVDPANSRAITPAGGVLMQTFVHTMHPPLVRPITGTGFGTLPTSHMMKSQKLESREEAK